MDSWASFTLGILLILVALYAPGFLFFRALRFTRMHALIAAPLFSACLYGALPIAYYELGIACTVPTTFGVALAAGGIVYAISRPWRASGNRPAFGLPSPACLWRPLASPRESSTDWGLLGLYLLCGLIVGCLVFAGNLSTPDAAYIRYDNQTHLNVSKAFLDTGMWSSLHPNRYLDLPVDARSVIPQGATFYPALLYALSALCALMAGLKITAAFNAVLFALAFVVFPLGMFGVMRVAFPNNRLVVALGAVTAISFAAFPWGVYVRGLFPNAAGICLMAPAIASCMMLLAHRQLKASIPRCVILWVFALPALGLAQPNAVFGAFLFLVSYTAHVAGKRMDARAAQGGRKARRKRIIAVAAVLGIGLVIWCIALNLPALQSAVHYFGNSIQNPVKVIRRTLLLRFDPYQGQWLLALVVLVGVVSCLRRRILWLLFPAAWMGISYILIRTGNTPVAHFLAGFWYCDHVRIAAYYSVFLMPIAAMGLARIAVGIRDAAAKTAAFHQPIRQVSLSAAAVALCIAVIFWPNVTLPGDEAVTRNTGFGTVYVDQYNMYREDDNQVYGSDEQAFVDKAREITQDALVLNYPDDGSSFAYAVNDMEVYYRSIKTSNGTRASKVIRLYLAEYAANEEVQAAVEETGAQYLLRLDQGVSYEDGKWFRQFKHPESWAGIEAVDEDTPGFSVVLSEGDMRLYRIDPL